jgi:hypothetical protein
MSAEELTLRFLMRVGRKELRPLLRAWGGGEKSGELNCSRTADPNRRKPKLYSIKIKSKLDFIKILGPTILGDVLQ